MNLPIKLNIPEKFYKEEVREGHLVTKEIKELWAVQLDLLNEVLTLCKENDIKVFVDSGTLLGAIRHKGFIPWDDDIDVMMFRPDYEKFCKIAKKTFKKPYFLQTLYNDNGYAQLHAKVRNSATTGIVHSEVGKNIKYNQGIFIDIFVYDYLPNDDYNGSKRARIDYLKETEYERKKLYRLMKATTDFKVRRDSFLIGTEFLRSIIATSGREPDDIVKEQAIKCDKLNKKYMKLTDSTRLYTQEFFSWKERRVIPVEYYSKTKMVKFEMLSVPIPYKYDEILEIWYGDWKKPVKGAALHGSVVSDVYTCYKDYDQSTIAARRSPTKKKGN